MLKTYHSCGIIAWVENCCQDSEDGKRTVFKICARKIVNCYENVRWVTGGHSTRRKTSSATGHKHLQQPGLIVQFLFKASDLATEVTPKGKQHLWWSWRSSTKTLNKESSVFWPILRAGRCNNQSDSFWYPWADKNLRRTSFRLTNRLSRHNRPYSKMAVFKLFFCSYSKWPH